MDLLNLFLKVNKTTIWKPFYKYKHFEKQTSIGEFWGVFFPCYLFCGFVCCLFLAMLHVYIYRDKHSCCRLFICSCIFSIRTGEFTFYKLIQFYTYNFLKIRKRVTGGTQNPFLLCHWKVVARKRHIQRQKWGNALQVECVGTVTGALLLGALTHTGVAVTHGRRAAGRGWDGAGAVAPRDRGHRPSAPGLGSAVILNVI